jgi:hypothetical protein
VQLGHPGFQLLDHLGGGDLRDAQPLADAGQLGFRFHAPQLDHDVIRPPELHSRETLLELGVEGIGGFPEFHQLEHVRNHAPIRSELNALGPTIRAVLASGVMATPAVSNKG